VDTLTELRAIITSHQAFDITPDKLLEIVAIESFKFGVNAGRVHEKIETNNKLAKLGVN
jgi:hypothetical protein